MVLVGVWDCSNTDLLLYALEHTPALVLDCANCANPHALFPVVDFDKFKRVYVMQVELLYVFRDALKQVARTVIETGAKVIIVTKFSHLIDYDDEEETEDLYEHAWELLEDLGKKHVVIIGVGANQDRFARRFCDERGFMNGTHSLEFATELGHSS